MSDEQTETMLRNVREGLAMDGTNPAPSPLTREQFDVHVETLSRPDGEPEYWYDARNALWRVLTHQAQEIERLKQEKENAIGANAILIQRLAAMTTEREEAVNAAIIERADRINAKARVNELEHKTVSTLQATLAAREAGYQKTISESIDQIDLQCDEFNRIKAITDNEEIKGICDRAVRDIGQRVPVIQQRDAAVQRAEQAEARVRELEEKYERV